MTFAAVTSTSNLWLLGVGFLAGVLGGLLGIGGGLVMIPAMVLLLGDHFGENSFHLYKLAAIATSIVLSIPAAIRHTRARAVVFPLLPALVAPAIVGVGLGVVLAALFDNAQTHVLKRIFGGFLLLVVASQVYQRWSKRHSRGFERDTCPVPARRSLYGSVVGFPAGFIAGLLGIGGGAWAVPAQYIGLGVRIQNAIANSAFMIVFIAPVTAILQSVAVHRMGGVHALDGWVLAAWLAPGAIIGGWCGAGLTHRLRVDWLRLVFHGLLVVTGVKLLMGW